MTSQSWAWLSFVKIQPQTKLQKDPGSAHHPVYPSASLSPFWGEKAVQVGYCVPGESRGEALAPRGMVSPGPAQGSWAVAGGHRMERDRGGAGAFPGNCVLPWIFLSSFFPQLFGLTAALPQVLVSSMASRSSSACS